MDVPGTAHQLSAKTDHTSASRLAGGKRSAGWIKVMFMNIIMLNFHFAALTYVNKRRANKIEPAQIMISPLSRRPRT